MEDPRSAAHPGRDEDRATMGVDPILVSPTPSPRRIAIEQPPMRIGRVGGNHGNTMPVPRHRIGEAAREGTDPGGLGAIKIAETQEAPERKSLVEGKSVAVRVDFGGRCIIKKKQKT